MEMMKAFVWEGNGVHGLKDVEKPSLQSPTDVIGRVTVNTICTSDVHIIEDKVPTAKKPNTLGHEFCIEVVEVGAAVKNVKVGDHAMVLAGVVCDVCPMCQAGFAAACMSGGAFGLMNLEGAQAEFVRVPLADKALHKIPEGFKDEDFLLVGDMYATAYFGITNGDVKEGQTVVVMGLGPIGFCACELLKKVFKANVIAVTRKEESLALALEKGIVDHVVNAGDSDAVGKVKTLSEGRGAHVVVETAGAEAAMNQSISMLRKGGILSTVSVFSKPLSINLQECFFKNIQIRTGIQSCKGVADMMKWVVEGVLQPNYIFTHRAPLNDIEAAYKIFGNKEDGCIKFLITPYEHDTV